MQPPFLRVDFWGEVVAIIITFPIVILLEASQELASYWDNV